MMHDCGQEQSKEGKFQAIKIKFLNKKKSGNFKNLENFSQLTWDKACIYLAITLFFLIP